MVEIDFDGMDPPPPGAQATGLGYISAAKRPKKKRRRSRRSRSTAFKRLRRE